MMRTIVALAVLAVALPASAAAHTDSMRLSYALQLWLSGDTQGSGDPWLVGAGLCLQGAHGSRALRLTSPDWAEDPAWAPGGRRLAFSRGGIFVEEESGQTRMVANVGNHNEHPDWSPDGHRIAFDAGAYGAGIYSVDASGRHERLLTSPDIFVWDTNPDWSPDGSTIAFDEYTDNLTPRSDLFLVDSDGRNQRLLISDGFDPSWSPDGRSLVFVRGSDLYVANFDGSGIRQLTSLAGNETEPAWSPDGQWIAFNRWAWAASWEGQHHDIAVVRPDGTDLHVAVGSPLDEIEPSWRPRARPRPGRQRPCVVRGTARRDVIRGTARGDLILAGAGNDLVSAEKGPDLVDAGPGRDRVAGDSGGDVIAGGLGQDRLLGGPGPDVLYSEDGEPDVLHGDAGVDEAWPDAIDLLESVEHDYCC